MYYVLNSNQYFDYRDQKNGICAKLTKIQSKRCQKFLQLSCLLGFRKKPRHRVMLLHYVFNSYIFSQTKKQTFFSHSGKTHTFSRERARMSTGRVSPARVSYSWSTKKRKKWKCNFAKTVKHLFPSLRFSGFLKAQDNFYHAKSNTVKKFWRPL